MNAKLLTLIVCAAGSVACKGEMGFGGDRPALLDGPAATETTTPSEQPAEPVSTTVDPTLLEPTEPEVVYEDPNFTPDQLVSYMRTIAQMLVSRPISTEEAERVSNGGLAAVEQTLREWSTQPAFAENARYMMQQKLHASGERDSIDFELPGNLVRHIVASDLPWSTVLTADYCINNAGEQTVCDTGAPYSAGVLATRAFMAGNASRFNLARANRLMEVFACRIYPMEQTLQPYLERASLIPMFQADTVEEQEVEAAKGGFGNGDGCYSCHGQFGAHAQLFVKYTEDGMYVADADGLQDPSGELGRSVNGLMTSHMIDPALATSEASQVFGADVSNIADAAHVIAQSPAFLPCQVGNIVHHVFGLSESVGIDPRLLVAVAERAREAHTDPTYADIVVAAFTEPRVILSAVGATEGGAP